MLYFYIFCVINFLILYSRFNFHVAMIHLLCKFMNLFRTWNEKINHFDIQYNTKQRRWGIKRDEGKGVSVGYRNAVGYVQDYWSSGASITPTLLNIVKFWTWIDIKHVLLLHTTLICALIELLKTLPDKNTTLNQWKDEWT